MGGPHGLPCSVKNTAESNVSEYLRRQCWEGFLGAVSDLRAKAAWSAVLRSAVIVSKLRGKECRDWCLRSARGVQVAVT